MNHHTQGHRASKWQKWNEIPEGPNWGFEDVSIVPAKLIHADVDV